MCFLETFTEDKRQTYDRHNGGMSDYSTSSASSSTATTDFNKLSDDFFKDFMFRDPDEIFKEFFGGKDPFAEFFSDEGFEKMFSDISNYFMFLFLLKNYLV